MDTFSLISTNVNDVTQVLNLTDLSQVSGERSLLQHGWVCGGLELSSGLSHEPAEEVRRLVKEADDDMRIHWTELNLIVEHSVQERILENLSY